MRTSLQNMKSFRSFGSKFFNRKKRGGAMESINEKPSIKSVSLGPLEMKLDCVKAMYLCSKGSHSKMFVKACSNLEILLKTETSSNEEAFSTYVSGDYDIIFVEASRQNSLEVIQNFKSAKPKFHSVFILISHKRCQYKPYIQAGYSRILTLDHLSFEDIICELEVIKDTLVKSSFKIRAIKALFSTLDSLPTAVQITDDKGNIKFVNSAFERLCGYSASDIVGQDSRHLLHDQVDDETWSSVWSTITKGKEWDGTLLTHHRNGDNIHQYLHALPLFLNKTLCNVVIIRKPILDSRQGSKIRYSTSSGDAIPESGINSTMNRKSIYPAAQPLSRVVNIIMSVQENCPNSVCKALDKALDLIQASGYTMPENISTTNDEVGDTFASGLLQQKSVKYLRSNNSSRSTVKAQKSTTGILKDPISLEIPEVIAKMLEYDNCWDFDIIELEKLSNKRCLYYIGFKIFKRFNAPKILKIPDVDLLNWLQMIESNYRDNIYHNSTHAADVLGAMAYFLQIDSISKVITDDLELIGCLIAAAVHDVDHPGKTNLFLINTRDPLAILYNDKSVLESHHVAFAFKSTLENENVNIFKNLDRTSYSKIRSTIVDLVLATDMAKHVECLNRFQGTVLAMIEVSAESSSPCNSDAENDSASGLLSPNINVECLKAIMIKCADISNPCRPLKLCITWAERIVEEYFRQTDEEKTMDIPLSMPTFDRTTCVFSKTQVIFMEIIIKDMFTAFDKFAHAEEVIQNMHLNYEYWKSLT